MFNNKKRCKSMSSFSDAFKEFTSGEPSFQSRCRSWQSSTISYSSVEVSVVNDSEYSDYEDKPKTTDSGLGDRSVDNDIIYKLEQKIDKLSDLFLEQCKLLSTLKEEIRNSKTVIEKTDPTSQIELINEIVNKAAEESSDVVSSTSGDVSSSKALLAAIENRSNLDYDQLIKELIADLLQSDEVKDQMVQATAESVKDVIGSCLSRDLSVMYLPVLEHSHRRLLSSLTRTIEEAFIELEQNSVCIARSVYKTSNSLRRAMERHKCLLTTIAAPDKNVLTTIKCSIEELLQNELSQWRQKVVSMLSYQSEEPEDVNTPSNHFDFLPPTEFQPPERTVVDKLMMSAEITKQIEEGEINDAFESALCAGDLSLVRAACRGAAAAGAGVAAAPQHVLLSLLQQLSTDMLYDTQLKCKYIEDALINLNKNDPITRTHLPLVLDEVCKNLSRFLASYPNHVASRRVAMIKMIAHNFFI